MCDPPFQTQSEMGFPKEILRTRVTQFRKRPSLEASLHVQLGDGRQYGRLDFPLRQIFQRRRMKGNAAGLGFSFECAGSEPTAISWFRSRWNRAARGPSVHFLGECYRSPQGVSVGVRNRSPGSTFVEASARERREKSDGDLVPLRALRFALFSVLAVFLVLRESPWRFCFRHVFSSVLLFIRFRVKAPFGRETWF